MGEDEAQTLIDLVPHLLQALDRLAFAARHMHPPNYAELMAALGEPDAPLRELRPALDAWPEALAGVRAPLATSADAVIAAFEGLRAAADADDGMAAVFRALGRLPTAEEALYPLAPALPPVNRFFLHPDLRHDEGRAQALAGAPPRPDVGVMHFNGEPGARGAFSMYVPEDYTPDRAWPVVFALHGGSGNGRRFLWSWLRDGRSFGAIVVAPTAVGRTWALQGEDRDSPNLEGILKAVRENWTVDERRILLSGMSDGGTFAYVSGLEPASPFTHLAPTSAAFHPMMAQFADPERLLRLPIHIAHGALDWMFDVGMARGAARSLEAAGAAVTYRELDDLSHTYPRELNRDVLRWLQSS